MNKKKTPSSKGISKIIIKLLIIFFVIFGIYYINNSFSNTISLLAVTEGESRTLAQGSVIDLTLRTRPGTGQIYVNLNTIAETDTQISIINSQKIACNLFNLDCKNYDFFYDFKGSSLLLKGPSASSAIAVLTVKTLKKEPLDKSTVITGSLNSGGIIGNVGGIDEKIMVAQKLGYDKVIIPVFSNYNETIEMEIEVVRVIDIIDAYNNYGGRDYNLERKEINNANYVEKMQILGDLMCNRTLDLKSQIDSQNITENSTQVKYLEQAEKSYNFSILVNDEENYYSQGSFCYNANINYRILIEFQKNLSIDERKTELTELSRDVNLKYTIINSNNYKDNINTINDFYVYLILLHRIEQAKEFILEAQSLYQDDMTFENIFNNSNETQVQDLLSNEQNDILYSYALERYYTVGLWEKFIENSGEEIFFTDDMIIDACLRINRDITMKAELLRGYGIGVFNDEINKQLMFSNPFSNQYLCIYSGLELNGKINTLLNSFGIEKENESQYTQKVLNITQSRINLNTNGDFPLIPQIYYEYSKDLFMQEDFGSSMLYSNYALSYTDLNLFLEKQEISKSYFNFFMNELFSFDFKSLLFIGTLLIILAFL